MATDLQGLSVRLSSGPAAQVILASAAVPGIFPPVVIDDCALFDGAIGANTPLRLATQLGATQIVVLPTGYACALAAPPKGVIARILHAVILLIAWQLMHEIETMPAGVTVHVAPALCPLTISPYDFTRSRDLVERARISTGEWIAGGGLERPSFAHELAAHRHKSETRRQVSPTG